MNLWMRWLDFRALRDLLLLVGRYADGLRANELRQLANDEGVLLRRDGRPYANSMHYHHRRTLERFGLLQKSNRHLILNRDHPGATALTVDSRPHECLLPTEQTAFADAVIQNGDCYDVFLSHFLAGRKPACDVATFVELGQPIQVAVQSRTHQNAVPGCTFDSPVASDCSKSVAIRRVGDANWSVAYGADAIQAIHFGMRSWCTDQLGFMDIAYRADGTYFAYPKHIDTRLTSSELAAAMFADLDFIGEWATVRIPDCTLEAGIKHRVSIEQAKDVLRDWLTTHPDLVAGIPSRVGFITAGLAQRQHSLALKSYLRSKNGAYMSHIRVHHSLRQHIREGIQNS